MKRLDIGRRSGIRKDEDKMPFYRFHIDSPLHAPIVLMRLRTIMRDKPGFWKLFKESLGNPPEGSQYFIGKVEGYAFHMQRDIRSRNSFLPQVRGSVNQTITGSRVLITMYLHPFVAVFMLFWLGITGSDALDNFMTNRELIETFIIPALMFLLGIAVTAGVFYTEAIKTRRYLEQKLTAPDE